MGSDMSSSAQEQRLNEAIAAYLQAAEVGVPLDRAAFLVHHAELAPELEAFFADWERFRSVAERLGPAAGARPAAEAPTLASGDTWKEGAATASFGDYELLEEISRGGMGVVYKARQKNVNRLVALKMILAGRFAAPSDVQRFRAEAEAAANLSHPHIVPIYEVGACEGQPFFSMKLIEGGSLAQALSRGRVAGGKKAEERWAAGLMAKIARAVHYAHQRGIFHRDLKPANILLDPAGEPHVADFGLAKRVDFTDARKDSPALTRTGIPIGTPSYMAPEQAAGRKELATATDVYALGAILYELLSGRPPFRAETPMDTLLLVLHSEPVLPRLANPKVDPDLETIAMKCLEKEPRKRYESAQSLAQDLERWLQGVPIGARPSTLWERTAKWARRRPAVASLIGVTVLAFVSVLALIAAFTMRLNAANTRLGTAVVIALTERDRAEEQHQQADAERRHAVEEKKLARERELLARRYWYGADMNLAQQAFEAGDGLRLTRILQRQIPQPGDVDLRSFEWRYLWRACHAEAKVFRQSGQVFRVAFSPDGKLLAAASTDALGEGPGQLHLWDVPTGKQLWGVECPGGYLTVTFAGDGKLLAVVGAQVTSGKSAAKIYQTIDGHSLAGLPLEGLALAAAFTPQHTRLLVGVAPWPTFQPDLQARVCDWDWVAGSRRQTLLQQKQWCPGPLAMAFAPDQRVIAVGGVAILEPPPRVREAWQDGADRSRVGAVDGSSALDRSAQP